MHRNKSRLRNKSSLRIESNARNLSVWKLFLRKYDQDDQNYDVAIMMLASPFDYTDYVRPACLPPPDFEFENGRMIVSGSVDEFNSWGLFLSTCWSKRSNSTMKFRLRSECFCQPGVERVSEWHFVLSLKSTVIPSSEHHRHYYTLLLGLWVPDSV